MRHVPVRRAFTMIEMIMVIVILGIVAGMSILAYSAVISRAEQTRVETELTAISRLAVAHSAMRGSSAPNFADVTAAFAEYQVDVVAVDDTLGGHSPDVNTAHYATDGVHIGVAWFYEPGRCALGELVDSLGEIEVVNVVATACTGDAAIAAF